MSFDPIDHDLERGLAQRRAVLGDAWVDQALQNATAFTAEFQHMITRHAWHDIWGRPGLPRKMRRALVLAITIALGRWEEYALHVRAALLAPEGDGLTPDELKEILMQAALYAGVPAANTAFVHAARILDEVGADIGYAPAPMSPLQADHPGTGHAGRTPDAPALHYTVRAPRRAGPARLTFVLSHALGCDLTMWDEVAALLPADCRIVAYDQRGHGASDTPPGGWRLADMADDAARLLRGLGAEPVVWIGVSMGGMVGQELALRYPSLVRALVLANTTSGYGAAMRAAWSERIAAVRERGLDAVADAVIARCFHDGYRAHHPANVARWRRRLVATDAAGYAACCEAVREMDTSARLRALRLPVLVIAGALDDSTPVAMARALADGIADARLVVLPGVAHLSPVEAPQAFVRAVDGFIDDL
jgi:3-oxoadipate enol-lactonase